MMEWYGVITGDIVNSRGIPGAGRELLYEDIKAFFTTLKKKKHLAAFDFFRGDSFQCLIADPRQLLRVALMVRCFIKAYSVELPKKRGGSRKKAVAKTAQMDVRLALGIGTVDFIQKKSLTQSDGEAFHLSGTGLDEMKTAPHRMTVKLADKAFETSLEPGILLLDALVQKWTKNQAEVVLYKLQDTIEEDIAAALSISQPAVSQRAKTAQWYAIEKMLSYFSSTLKNR